MAKIKQPAPATEAPTTEAPAPDMAPLIQSFSEIFATREEAEQKVDECNLEIAVIGREFREENPTVERPAILLAVQTAVATAKKIKLSHLTNYKDQSDKVKKDAGSAYTLTSSLMSMIWHKNPDIEKKGAKLSSDEIRKEGWVKFKTRMSKKHNRTEPDPDRNKITEANFAEKLGAFLTQAVADGVGDTEYVSSLALTATEAWEKSAVEAPKA